MVTGMVISPEKLTVELANRRAPETVQPVERELPKIQGKSG